ncbi:hypothetical protein J4Q44_G00007260 [Coregonus suidteri]|uniref:Transposase n=1 Tax=Coregonus suidteri TaxID=861788 RepID=A0AAN8ML46_9TELE
MKTTRQWKQWVVKQLSQDRKMVTRNKRRMKKWFVDVATILNEDDGFEYQLPKHQHCACHLLNLLLHPNATRWNSWFMAVERLLRIVKDKGEAAVRFLCADFEVPMFIPSELTILTEYAATMSPVAKAINILQAETNVQMGWLLPTINLLITKLDRIKLSLKYCKPLVDALQLGLKKRFSHMFHDPKLIAAAILLPKFKTTWTKDDTTNIMGMD